MGDDADGRRGGAGAPWPRWLRWAAVGVALAAVLALVWTGTRGGPGSSGASPDRRGAPGADVERASPNTPGRVGFDVSVPSAILIDAGTGQVLFEKGADEPVHPASIVKVMTMLVTMDAVKAGHVSLDDPVRISKEAASMGGSQVYLAAGETWSLEQLMEALAIASANDAAVAIAEHVAGTEGAFVALMNRRAQELGLKATRFVNAHGLPQEGGDDANVTTAREIAIMARELVTRYPEVLRWTSIRSRVFREQPRFVMTNTNRLVGAVPGVDGLKTGFTSQAGYSVVATAERDGRRLIAVVMRADSDDARVEQASRLLEFGFRAFRPVVLALPDEQVGELRLRGGQPERVPVTASRMLYVLTLGGDRRGVTRSVLFRPALAPPIEKGQAVGWVVGQIDGREAARVEALAGASVEPVSGPARLWRWVRDAVRSVLP